MQAGVTDPGYSTVNRIQKEEARKRRNPGGETRGSQMVSLRYAPGSR